MKAAVAVLVGRCRYSAAGGDGIVFLETTGSDTFEIQPSR
jgi:hypothetical protein